MADPFLKTVKEIPLPIDLSKYPRELIGGALAAAGALVTGFVPDKTPAQERAVATIGLAALMLSMIKIDGGKQ